MAVEGDEGEWWRQSRMLEEQQETTRTTCKIQMIRNNEPLTLIRGMIFAVEEFEGEW